MANKTTNTGGGLYNKGTINAKNFSGRDTITNNYYAAGSNQPKIEDNLKNLSSLVIESLQQQDVQTARNLLKNTSENLKENPSYKILCALTCLAHKNISELPLPIIRETERLLEIGLHHEETRVVSLVILGIINYDFYRKNGLPEVSPSIKAINIELSQISWQNHGNIKTLLGILNISHADRWSLKITY